MGLDMRRDAVTYIEGASIRETVRGSIPLMRNPAGRGWPAQGRRAAGKGRDLGAARVSGGSDRYPLSALDFTCVTETDAVKL